MSSNAARFVVDSPLSWPSELVLYAIHGLLHLAGYADANASARRRMKREENRLLKDMEQRFPLKQLGAVRRPQSRRRHD